MLRNESFKNNYNLTRKDSDLLKNESSIKVNNEFFHVQKNSKKILIKDEKKENIAICAYFCI